MYASTNVINFAQGEFYMLGGMFAYFALNGLGLPLPFAVLAAILIVTFVGIAFDRLAIRPRRDAGPMSLIIITVGASMVFQSFARHAFGPDEQAIPAFSHGPSLSFLGAAIDRQAIWIWGITFIAVAALTILYSKTKLGAAMRATMENRDAARLMGINTERIVMISFGLAAGLGAIAGIAVMPLTQSVWDGGPGIAVKGFAAAILGGLGGPFAAVAGGVVLGLVESLSIAYLSSTYKDVVALAVLLAVLVLRPQGLFTRSSREKV